MLFKGDQNVECLATISAGNLRIAYAKVKEELEALKKELAGLRK